MLSTPHLLVGATTGSLGPNPAVAFLLGFLSHFLMDKLPHWDWQPKSPVLWLLTLFEFAMGALFLFYLTKNSSDPFLIWAGAVGGVSPDLLSVPYNYLNFKFKIFEHFDRFHNWIQKSNHRYSLATRILLQLLVVILSTYLLLK